MKTVFFKKGYSGILRSSKDEQVPQKSGEEKFLEMGAAIVSGLLCILMLVMICATIYFAILG